MAAQGDDPAARSRASEAISAACWKPLYKYVEEARLLSISQGKFVNEYVEQDGSADGKTLILVSERIENIADGWRARQTYKFVNQDEYAEAFELAEPQKEFAIYSESQWKRVK